MSNPYWMKSVVATRVRVADDSIPWLSKMIADRDFETSYVLQVVSGTLLKGTRERRALLGLPVLWLVINSTPRTNDPDGAAIGHEGGGGSSSTPRPKGLHSAVISFWDPIDDFDKGFVIRKLLPTTSLNDALKAFGIRLMSTGRVASLLDPTMRPPPVHTPSDTSVQRHFHNPSVPFHAGSHTGIQSKKASTK